MLGLQVTEEQLQSIAERAIQEADLDKDDAISFDEFRKVGVALLQQSGFSSVIPSSQQNQNTVFF